MQTYYYNGPVMEFDRVVSKNWKATTEADSEKKARSNLSYRYKKENNRTANSKIKLPGEMVVS